MITIKVPGFPPSANRLYATVNGRRIKTRELHRWRAHVVRYFPPNMVLKATAKYSVQLWFGSPNWFTKAGTPRIKDLDNLIKATLDAVFEPLKQAGISDAQVFQITAMKTEEREDQVVIGIYDLVDN